MRYRPGVRNAPGEQRLNADAPLTCQFALEDYAVRHSYHHLTLLRAALQRYALAALNSFNI